MASITCGNCKLTHDTVEAVRSCYAIQRQDPTSVTPSQASKADQGWHDGPLLPQQDAAIGREMHPSHANNPIASKMIKAAGEKRGVRFAPSEPLFTEVSDEEHQARIAKLEQSLGFTKRPERRMPRSIPKVGDTVTVNVGNRNSDDQTREGFYKVGDSFFKVTPARTSNRTFAHLLTSAKDEAPVWEYKGLARVYVPADAPRLTVADAAEYGKTSGVCMICGRLLTAEDSVAAGIGPICAGKL